jgi:hypothetical protein
MRNLFATACALAALLGWLSPPASAQAPMVRRSAAALRPAARPVTSPYLNLLDPAGRGLAFNYYRRVRPELEFRRADERLSRSVHGLERQIPGEENRPTGQTGLSPTGHAATFMNSGGYFPLLQRRAGARQ